MRATWVFAVASLITSSRQISGFEQAANEQREDLALAGRQLGKRRRFGRRGSRAAGWAN